MHDAEYNQRTSLEAFMGKLKKYAGFAWMGKRKILVDRFHHRRGCHHVNHVYRSPRTGWVTTVCLCCGRKVRGRGVIR